MAQGAFKVGAKALTGHSSFQSWAALHLILPNYNCDQGAIGRTPLGSAPQLTSWDPQSPQTYPRLTCHVFGVPSVASLSPIPIVPFWKVSISAAAAPILEACSLTPSGKGPSIGLS